MRRLTATLAVLALAVAVFAGGAALAASAPHKRATVKTRTSSLGKIIVDGKSHTLYLFKKDKHGESACSGPCAQNWPPLLTKGKPKAGHGARSSLLGTTRRADGTTQVTYRKHPLYTFVGDNGKPGSTTGEGLNAFGAHWYVVSAKGTANTGSSGSSNTAPPMPGPYGY
jgi:predicted lipoprotein with Yx(FWY)xxD motif